jgi:hypothetical protein
MGHLQELRLRRNGITEVPDVFSKLQKLRVIDLGQNCLTVFPMPICRCVLLEELDLSENMIPTVPEVRALHFASYVTRHATCNAHVVPPHPLRAATSEMCPLRAVHRASRTFETCVGW